MKGSRRRPRPEDEVMVMGLGAVRALVDRRLEDVVRVYVTEARVPELSRLLKWCASHRKAYHVVSQDELDRVADSVHHEGVLVLAKARPPLDLDTLVDTLAQDDGPVRLVMLEEVKNPHNVGAIMRISAHFGVRALILAEADAARLGPAALRTAEGGAEAVDLVRIPDPLEALEALRAVGVAAVGTSSHTKRSLFDAPLPSRTLIVLGSEGEGLSRDVLAACDRIVAIPGTGAVESLNVSTAASILLAEHWRVSSAPAPRPSAERRRGLSPRRGGRSRGGAG